MYFFLKRCLDIVISLISLILLSIPMIIISLMIKCDSKGPILFKQKRIGKDKVEFNIYKFRTMYVDTPAEMPTHLLENPDIMITKVGKILRKTSLDELPQLFNILKGEMSIIGPRPALWNQYDLINERDKKNVNSIRPGLTGWAQINGRDELKISEKVKYDSFYLNNLNFILDLKCFFGTFLSVFRADGVVEGKSPTRKESE